MTRKERILKLVHEIVQLKNYLSYDNSDFLSRCLAKRNFLLSQILKNEIIC